MATSSLPRLVTKASKSPLKQAGVVVSAGRMQHTVKVRLAQQTWNRKFKKYFTSYYNCLVNDPNDSILEGDVITMRLEEHSKRVKHTVHSIVAPFGKPVEERPPIMTPEERKEYFINRRKAKAERRAERGIPSAVKMLKVLRLNEKYAKKKVEQMEKLAEQLEAQRLESGGATDGGRKVLEGGLHQFGGINEEALAAERKTSKMLEQGIQNEIQREEVQERPVEEVGREDLEKTPGKDSDNSR